MWQYISLKTIPGEKLKANETLEQFFNRNIGKQELRVNTSTPVALRPDPIRPDPIRLTPMVKDYQTHILIQDLKKAKTEMDSLNSIISLMKKDIEILEKKNESFKNTSKCVNCFPPIIHQKSDIDNKTRWEKVHYSKSPSKKITLPKHKANPIPVKNKFSVLKDISTEEISQPKFIRDNSITFKRNVNKSDKEQKERDTDFRNINIFSDSMGRNMPQILLNILGHTKNIRVTGLCKPGATLSGVTSSVTAPEDGYTCSVIMGGANDVAANDIASVFNNLDTTLKKLQGTSTLICTIPNRYDLPHNHYLNDKIYQANQYIKELVSRHSTAHLINLNGLRRHNYTRHGFHINKSGKYKIANWIVTRMEKAAQGINKPNVPMNATLQAAPHVSKHTFTVSTSVAAADIFSHEWHKEDLDSTEQSILSGESSIFSEQLADLSITEEQSSVEETANTNHQSTTEEQSTAEETATTNHQSTTEEQSTAEETSTTNHTETQEGAEQNSVSPPQQPVRSPGTAFETPDRTRVDILQSMVDKPIQARNLEVDLDLEKNKHTYFLRRGKRKNQKT